MDSPSGGRNRRSRSRYCRGAHLKRLLRGDLQTNGLKRVMNATASQFAHGLDSIRFFALTTPPNLREVSLDLTVSTAMTRPAPAIAAPLTRKTYAATDDRDRCAGPTFAVLMAPTPVVTPHRLRCAIGGISARILTIACSCTSMWSANDARFAN